MILEYSYDKMNFILDLFRESKIASLTISKGADSYVMEYTKLEDLSPEDLKFAKETLNNSLPERLNAVNVLNQFMEKQIMNTVIEFSFRFNVVRTRKCQISYTCNYSDNAQDESKRLTEQLIQCLENYDRIVTEMGIADQKTPNIFEKSGNGKNKSYSALSIRDVGNVLRHALVGDVKPRRPRK